MLLNKYQTDKVIGEIYKITNTVTNKCYIGQTRSHRLNHEKYRPFGHIGRFKDHVHEAHSNKKNQSWFLNNAIQKYGVDCFQCELLLTCKVSELDTYEKQYILEHNSKYPNGYNLTDGGQIFTDIKSICKTVPLIRENIKRNGVKRSDYTKKLYLNG